MREGGDETSVKLTHGDKLAGRQNSRHHPYRSEYVCEEFVHSRVELMVNKIDDTLPAKLAKSKLIQERKRKVMWYSVPGDGAVSWDTAKKRRLNLFSGTGPGHSESRIKSVLNTFEAMQGLERDEEVSHRNILARLARTNSNRAKGAGDCVRKTMTSKFFQNATVSCLIVVSFDQRESHLKTLCGEISGSRWPGAIRFDRSFLGPIDPTITYVRWFALASSN